MVDLQMLLLRARERPTDPWENPQKIDRLEPAPGVDRITQSMDSLPAIEAAEPGRILVRLELGLLRDSRQIGAPISDQDHSTAPIRTAESREQPERHGAHGVVFEISEAADPRSSTRSRPRRSVVQRRDSEELGRAGRPRSRSTVPRPLRRTLQDDRGGRDPHHGPIQLSRLEPREGPPPEAGSSMQ